MPDAWAAGIVRASACAFISIESRPMPKRRQPEEPQEPIGIVISGGPHEDPIPRLSAYVYSIEDETSGEPIDVKAA